MDEQEDPICPVCDEPVDSGPWVLLNRYAFGTGRHRCMAEGRNEDGEYDWLQVPDDPDAQEVATGKVLHFPTCTLLFFESRMIEVDYEMRAT